MNNKTDIKNKSFADFVDFLSEKLQEQKPGQSAHELMAPRLKGELFRKFKAGSKTSDSAVLLLLTGDFNHIELLFTLRAKSLINHSGQISFPGGKIEQAETNIDAALRETYEETGIESEKINIIGELSTLFVPPSNSIIHPVVAYISRNKIDIRINPDEVEEAFFSPLSFFLHESSKQSGQWNINGSIVDVPFWNIHKTTPLWGATAMILSEFLVISKSYFSEKNI